VGKGEGGKKRVKEKGEGGGRGGKGEKIGHCKELIVGSREKKGGKRSIVMGRHDMRIL